tara:strand:- start:3266 stop:4036 length:771 start_codon:yes stop_codon:yes gene_type:complete
MNQEYKKKYLKYKRKYLNLEISRIKGGNKQIGGSTYIILGGLLVFIITAIIGSYILISKNKIESKNNTNIHTEHIITTNQHYEQQIQSLIQELAQLREGKKQLEETLGTKIQEIEHLQKQIEDLTANLKDKESENATLKEKIKNLEQKIEDLKVLNTALNKENDTLNAQNKELQEEIEILTAKLYEKATENEQLIAKKEELENEIDDLKSKINKLIKNVKPAGEELNMGRGSKPSNWDWVQYLTEAFKSSCEDRGV